MTTKIERLSALLAEHFGERAKAIVVDRGEVTLEVAAADYLSVAIELRDRAEFGFDQLIDVSGVDYSAWANQTWSRERYAASTHLLSIVNNWRLRLRAFAPDDSFPVLDSLCDVWPSANWFEREAFDLFGIMFSGHPDLRRILTDYGFVGHPFRKDFPVSGYVEMRYDPEQGRVVYQPVTIEPRENTPRIVREANYGDVGHG
ncbi:NADH-quinone oxidoreductase subunit C [Denitromonas sp.]|uniref:NADH-quinone oxidoreductase subunit C n=1 Tax=Denitromonas sp. TaxID=2734609 RepID=UPI002AFED92C|nr:NADH-quinone oxidoreductase subunit C [Denitromonas sp.]